MSDHLTTLPFKSTLIKASAGSGKTYQLALRFITLLLVGVRPERIIALTFTRKAAGEFGARILTTLAKAARSEESAQALLNSLVPIYPTVLTNPETYFPVTENEVKARVPALFENPRDYIQGKLYEVVKALSRLNLQTLDSFFQKIIRQLAPELGFHNIELLSEAQKKALQKKLLQDLFSTRSMTPDEIEELFAVLKETLLSEDSDQAEQTLDAIISKLHDMYNNEPNAEQWGCKDRLLNESLYNDGVIFSKEQGLECIASLEEEGFVDYQGGDKRASGMREKLLAQFKDFFNSGKPQEFGSSYAAERLIEDLFLCNFVEIYYKKEVKFPVSIQKYLYRLFASYSNHFIEKAFKKTKLLYSILEKFDALYTRQVRDKGLFTFDDFKNYLLDDQLTTINPQFMEVKGDLVYRMDGWYDHWLLDEFQDTSFAQWEILKGFVEEVASNSDKSLFIVGDKKQSIYEWRGGEPRLFNFLEKDPVWAQTLHAIPLSVSWRTAQEILDVSNVCLRTSLYQGIAPLWEFDEQKTAEPQINAGLKGCVQYSFLPKENDLNKEKEVPAVEAPGNECVIIDNMEGLVLASNSSVSSKTSVYVASETIPDTWKDHKAPTLLALTKELKRLDPLNRGLSCAILTISNKQAREVYQWLISKDGGAFSVNLEADIQGGTDSPLGVAIIDFFKWMMAPEGGNQNPYLQHLKCTPLDELVNVPEMAWFMAHKVFAEKGVTGVLKMIKAYLQERIKLSPFHQQRLAALLKEARSFDKISSSLNEWIFGMESLVLVRENKENAINVLTIHKAKGLEYDVVMLPFATSDPFDNKKRLDWLVKKNPQGQTLSRLYKTNLNAFEMQPSLKNLITSWEWDQNLAGLCKLYVAITRPKHQLVVFLPEKKDKKKKDEDVRYNSFSKILTLFCEDQEDACMEVQNEKPSYSSVYFGDVSWISAHPIQEKLAEESSSQPEIQLMPPKVNDQQRIRASEAGDELVSTDSARDFGSTVHALLESIDWLPESRDLPPFLEVDTPEASVVRACLSQEEVRVIFTRPQGLKRLWKERQIMLNQGDTIVRGVVDRAYWTGDQLVVIDYKTTALDSENEFAERYAPQLKVYAELISSALPTPPSEVKGYILSTHLKKLIPVTLA